METAAGYSEATASATITSAPLSHLSIEVGHFYMNDLTNGEDRIRAQFKEVKRRLDSNIGYAKDEFGPKAKVSTCFLIDDYFGPDTDPGQIIGKLLKAADECGMTIDYLAREEGCFESPVYVDGVATGARIPLAEMVASWIVPEPILRTTGRRPPTDVSGWLCNGRRSSDYDTVQAMRSGEYRPAEEYGRREHSIFLDTQLWAVPTKKSRVRADADRVWACPFLASVWQLMRLDLLRYHGAPVAQPQLWPVSDDSGEFTWPKAWRDMPAVVQLNPDAHPFAAYRAVSILPRTYVSIEHAVEVILGHLEIDDEVIDLAVRSGVKDGVTVPRPVSHRLEHLFVPETWAGRATTA
ncbi:SCO2522 family protein [Nocardia sp. CWNU-33]|uniref:SCO2522 family protein n=1 Tax=Nocardia sp. CWNU-33 TaxID=3392117 RepID=UPI00398EB4AE